MHIAQHLHEKGVDLGADVLERMCEAVRVRIDDQREAAQQRKHIRLAAIDYQAHPVDALDQVEGDCYLKSIAVRMGYRFEGI